MQRVLVLGGGTGGALVANLLVRRLNPAEAQVVLISATPRHMYQPGWLYAAFGWQDPRALTCDLRRLLDRKVRLEIAPVTGLDTESRSVTLADGRSFEYDFLVIATGARLVPEEVPGLAEAGHHFYSETAVCALRQALGDFTGGRIVVGVGGLPYKCPVAPLEFTFLLADYLASRKVLADTEITYTYPIDRVFPIASVAELARPLLEERGVRVETFFNLEAVDPDRRLALSMEGAELPFDLLVMVPPHRGARFLAGSSVADVDGWVKVDRHTLEAPGHPGVFALGDAADLPVSKAGSAAHYQAPVVASRIVAAIRGGESNSLPRYEGKVICFLETGQRRATFLAFDYEHPPRPARPNLLRHYQKLAFNRVYCSLVPTGRI